MLKGKDTATVSKIPDRIDLQVLFKPKRPCKTCEGGVAKKTEAAQSERGEDDVEDVNVSVDKSEQVDSVCTMFGKHMENKQIPARMSNAWWGHFRERSQPRYDASSGIRSVSKHATRAWHGTCLAIRTT